MNDIEVKQQMDRIVRYRNLETLLTTAREALLILTEDWPTGPCSQGPFTGNAREARKVRNIHLELTETRGGAPAVETRINEINIEAHELGAFLEAKLRARIVAIQAERDSL